MWRKLDHQEAMKVANKGNNIVRITKSNPWEKFVIRDQPFMAEVHWFEAHGIGKRKMRIKRFLD